MAEKRYIQDKHGKFRGAYPRKSSPVKPLNAVAMLQFIEPETGSLPTSSYDTVYASFADQARMKEQQELTARFLSSGCSLAQAEEEADKWLTANARYEERAHELTLRGYTRSDAQGAIYADDYPRIVFAAKALNVGSIDVGKDTRVPCRASTPGERQEATRAAFYTSPTDTVKRFSTSVAVRTGATVAVLNDGQIIASITTETDEDAISLYEATCRRLPE